MVRFAVIGTNFITDSFMEAVEQCQDATVCAVYSRTKERAKQYGEKYGISIFYDSLEELADSGEVDAVYIASPNAFHFPQAMQMLQAGKHVLVEKPAASNTRELKKMIHAASENGVVLLEAMRPVFDPGFRAIQEQLPKIGMVRRATFQFCQYSRRYDKYKEGQIENAFKPELSNGSLMDLGVYCIHPLVKLFGRPKAVLGHCYKLSTGADAQGTVISIYDNMQAEAIFSKITQGALPSQIQGEDGAMLIREIADTKQIELVFRGGEKEVISIDKKENNMFYEVEEFVRLIGNGTGGEEHHTYSIWTMEILDEARKQMGIEFPADKNDFSCPESVF